MLRIATIAALLLLPSLAWADARKIDFTVVLADADGEALFECDDNPPPPTLKACKDRKPVTLGAVAMRALTTPEQNLKPEDALKRGQLALLVYRSAGAELTAEEISLLKQQIAKFYGPLVVVRAFSILDPAAK